MFDSKRGRSLTRISTDADEPKYFDRTVARAQQAADNEAVMVIHLVQSFLCAPRRKKYPESNNSQTEKGKAFVSTSLQKYFTRDKIETSKAAQHHKYARPKFGQCHLGRFVFGAR